MSALRAESGLSPRTRGKLYGTEFGNVIIGPIPANTGETFSLVAISTSAWAYPREHGGNCDR